MKINVVETKDFISMYYNDNIMRIVPKEYFDLDKFIQDIYSHKDNKGISWCWEVL